MTRIAAVSIFLCFIAGCGDPPLYPITGKVTLAGKPFERLLVYFHPADGKATAFTMGVGETAADGTLSMRSTAGNGLAKGKYRVSFACFVTRGSRGATVGLDSGKGDDNQRYEMKEDIVPPPYNSAEESPVVFEVSGSAINVFEFDIPAK
jgi:hypothetical protein